MYPRRFHSSFPADNHMQQTEPLFQIKPSPVMIFFYYLKAAKNIVTYWL